jgi:hypothetical protein
VDYLCAGHRERTGRAPERKNASRCKYALLFRNTGLAGSAFMLGRISLVVPTSNDICAERGLTKYANDARRSFIMFDRYALIDQDIKWNSGQNPVRYEDVTTLGIHPLALEWQNVLDVQPDRFTPKGRIARDLANADQDELLDTVDLVKDLDACRRMVAPLLNCRPEKVGFIVLP